MSIHIPKSSDINKIITGITDSENFIDKTILNVSQSIESLPKQIKSNVLGDYNSLLNELKIIKEECEYTSSGIELNVRSYDEQIRNAPRVASSGVLRGGFSLTTSTTGNLKMADKEFFQGLSKGTYNEETGIYVLDEYEYNVNNGVLKVNGKRSKAVFGIYVPENASNLSKLNTITFLHGNETLGGSFNKTHNLVEPSVNNCPSDTILILPQANTENDNSKGFVPYSSDVVSGTEFVKRITAQEPSQGNALIGFSSGFKSAYKIAANEGKNTYDTVVGINGYIEPMNSQEIAALRDKDLVMYVARDECSDVAWQRRMDSLDTVKNSGLRPKIITGSREYLNKANKFGFDTSFIEDDGFVGHGGGCQYAVKKLDALHCFRD